MDLIYKFKELMPGDYKVLSFEKKHSVYGTSFIIEAMYENKEEMRFWSPVYLTNYIIEKKPVTKFVISIDGSHKLIIPNYSIKTILV
mgnify:CR=1 FL=1